MPDTTKLKQANDAADQALSLIEGEILALRQLRQMIRGTRKQVRSALSTADAARADSLLEAAGEQFYALRDAVPQSTARLRSAADEAEGLLPTLEAVLPPEDPRPPEGDVRRDD